LINYSFIEILEKQFWLESKANFFNI
jgi:hypothetical protein